MHNKNLNHKQRGYVVNGVLVNNMSRLEILKHKFNGWLDANKNVIHKSSNGIVTSPYIETQRNKYNANAAKLWQTASANATVFVNELDKHQSVYDECLMQLVKLTQSRDDEINAIRQEKIGSDDAVDPATLSARKNRRANVISDKYESKINELNENLKQICAEVSEFELLSRYESIEEQYQDIHDDYQSKLNMTAWIYLDSASKRNKKFDLSSMHDMASFNCTLFALDTSQKELYLNNHKKYCFNKNERMNSLYFKSLMSNKKKTIALINSYLTDTAEGCAA